MSESSEIPIHFIRDEPAEEDFFNSHSKIAQTIRTAIADNPHIRTIGLLGPWGSGKSTVIFHLKRKLEADASNLVFTYDAWVHQSEPVRRSFLERLIHFLIAQKVTTEPSWKGDLDELNGKVTQTKTTPIPALTKNAAWLLFSALLVPIGVSLIDLDTIKGAFGAHTNLAGVWTLKVALLFIFAPVLVLAWRYLITRPYRTFENLQQLRKWNQTGDPSDDLSAIFLTKSVKSTLSITSQSPDPTAIEFATTFRKVMKTVDEAEKQLFFVIDNLDRVAAKDALETWATIRSFFLTPALEEDYSTTFPHPLVILPIDDTAIERLFDGSDELVVSFLNKTFDVTFRVTPPVLSDWKSFLKRQLIEALGPRASNSFAYWTGAFFEHWRAERIASVTPREINKFVNTVAALTLQWEKEGVPLETIAFYAAAFKSISQNILEFVKSDQNLVPPSSDWQREIAALHFGVPLEKAAQVLLAEEIEKAIAQNDPKLFGEYSALPGFYDALGGILQRFGQAGASGTGATLITNAAMLLAARLPPDDAWNAEAWNSLSRAYIEVAANGIGLPGLDKRIGVFLPFLTDGNRQAFYEVTLRGLGPALVSADSGDALAIGRLAVDLESDRKRHGLEPIEIVLGDDSASTVVQVLLRLASIPKAIALLRSDADPGEVADLLSERLADQQAAPLAAKAVGLLMRSETEKLMEEEGDTWEPLASSALNLVRQNADNPIIANAALETVCQLVPKSPTAKESVDALANEGVLTARMQNAFEAGNENLFRDALALLIAAQHSFSPPGSMSWRRIIERYPDLPKNILHRIRQLYGPTAIHKVWDAYHETSYGPRDLLEEILNYAVRAKDLGNLYIKDILSNIRYFTKPLNWRLEGTFIDQLQNYNTFWDSFGSIELNESAEGFAEIVGKRESEQGAKIQQALRDKIGLVDVAGWQNAIKVGGELYSLAMTLSTEEGFNLGKSSNLYKALESEIGSITKAYSSYAARWVELTGLLSPNARRAAFKAFGGEILAGRTGRNLVILLKAGGQQLVQLGEFTKHPDEALRNIFLRLAENSKGREWLKDHAKEVRSWINKATKTCQEDVKRCLYKMAKSSNANRRYWAELIISELNL